MTRIKNHFHDEIADRGKDPADYVTEELNEMSETDTNHWNDRFNDIFVDKRGDYWTVTIRARGNISRRISTHNKREVALAKATKIANDRVLWESLSA